MTKQKDDSAQAVKAPAAFSYVSRVTGRQVDVEKDADVDLDDMQPGTVADLRATGVLPAEDA